MGCYRKVGKGGAKMVKAGLKAAKKGAGVASAHSAGGATPPTILPTTYVRHMHTHSPIPFSSQ